jgi:hypothetical protein
MLQIQPVQDQHIAGTIEQLISDINKSRVSKNLAPLTTNAGLIQIINQWAGALRKSMSLMKYMQLYGILDTQTYFFNVVPLQNIKEVI